ncbi:LOW QUALITY PROTEIN: X-box-binding protein 1 [Antennarius striatus]|uniref:LOW QUALITY PROTEIN: X-box-binding protein 1 n=1 Tax=Antennarius striatus TaxID=241820 RepID=UPI0035B23A2B
MVMVTAGTGGTHKVLLISGKQSGGSQTGFSRPISVVLPSASSQASSDSDSNCSSGPPIRKRQRLTHLSPEEKALRRKLKNRVAAQTARDRKKAKMGELEQQVLELELENQKLHIENRLLREKTSGLLTENEELRQRLCLDSVDMKEKVQGLLSTGNEAGFGIGSSERSTQAMCASAAGAGPAVPKSEDFSMDTDSPDSQDNESDLLLGFLDILDPEMFLGSCETEPEVQLVGGGDPIPATTPSTLGSPSVKLEAINELIHFDHIYTKPVEKVNGEQYSDSESDADEKVDENSFPVIEVLVEDETVCVKDEPEEVVIPSCNSHSKADDVFSGAPHPTLGRPDKEACLADTYSDSGYEGSPSPFSDMSSPLCAESAWDDIFANELFPQLISV